MKIFSAGVLRIFPPQWPDGSRAKTPGEAQTEAAKSEERPLKQGWDLSDDYHLVVERFAKNKMVHLVSTVNYMFVWDIQAFWDWYLAIQEAKSQLKAFCTDLSSLDISQGIPTTANKKCCTPVKPPFSVGPYSEIH